MKSAKRYAIIVGVLLALIIVVVITLAVIFGFLAELLYICLTVLAVLMVGATLFQIYTIVQLIKTITTVRDEVKPLLASAQETIGIMKDTAKTAGSTVSTIGNVTTLTADLALGPTVRTAATVMAGGQMLRVFLGKGRIKSRAEERRRQQLEAMEAAAARGGE